VSPWRLSAFLLFLLPGLAFLPQQAGAQTRKELEKKREQLDKQIKTTSSLIYAAEKEQRSAQQQVQLLNAQIGQRQELISTMNSELYRVDQEIGETEHSVTALKNDLKKLKEEYARMVQYAYMNRNAYDRLSYIFAAESFSQAFKRSRYLDQLAEQRRQQAVMIQQTQVQLGQKAEALKAQRGEKVDLLSVQLEEKKKLTTDKQSHETTLSKAKKEEGKLRETLKKQERQRSDLKAAIKKAIEAEIGKSAKKTTTKPKAGEKGTGSEKVEYTLTPEARELGADFEKNRGKLPWPVTKGTITSPFGKQSHPVLKGIIIENNGIDIGCEKGSTVRAIFRGEVSSVIVIPGAGKAVIVNHGAYRTVYSGLREVSVAKGDKLETKQNLGVVMTDDGESTAHIEIWKITTDGLEKVDPARWIYQE
jgi:murein hydrolase activator